MIVARTSECSEFQVTTGECKVHGSIGNGSVDVGGLATTPGGPSNGGRGGEDGNATPADPTDMPQPGDPNYIYRDPFGVVSPVSIRDLRRFHPNPGTDHMQPSGWTVIGLDTNFYSVVGPQVLHGRLLGEPVAVRFSPVAWHWAYGDGTSAARGTGGMSWEAQGTHEFDATPTSHVYRHTGIYYIDLGVEFAAEYKFADDEWLPVTGTLTVPANRLKTSVGDATTVLVGRDCTQTPKGAGC